MKTSMCMCFMLLFDTLPLRATALPATLPSVMTAVHVEGKCYAPDFACVGVSQAVPVPSPAAGMVLLKVGGSSVNPCDTDWVQGVPGCHYNGDGTPGGDVAGEVVALGDGVERLKVGDRVWANRFELGGGMAEYALVGGADIPLGDTDAGAQEGRKSTSE